MLGRDHALGREQVVGHPALTDPATGLANRLHFELVYRYLFLAGDRGVAFTILLLSAGRGAAVEDAEMLRAIGRAIGGTTRSADLVAHLGEGRYVVLLLGTNLPGARIASDRLESALAEVTPGPVSIGLAAFDPTMADAEELLEAADAAMLRAEAAGGGVEMAAPPGA